MQLALRSASFTLHGIQQVLLEGLTAGLLLGGSSGGSTHRGSGSSSAPASPRKGPGSPFKRQAALPPAPTLTFFQAERLLVEHRHDGSFSLHQVQQLGGAALASSSGDEAGAAAAVTSSPLGLQRLSLQLGATTLVASKLLLLWAQQQQVAAQAARARRATPQRLPSRSGRRGPLQLRRLLALLPKDVELAVESCTLETDAGSSSNGSADSLPLQAALGLRGVSCRLAGAAPASSGALHAGPLARITAGWQHLAISLGAAAAAGSGEPQLPSALAMSSGAAEWSLSLSEADLGAKGQGQPQQPQLAAAFQVSIGALHTDVCHPAMLPLVVQLRLAAKSAREALKPAARAASAESGTPAAEQVQPQAPATKKAVLLAQWQACISLGDGSRLLFTDAAGRCCWSSGLASCCLAVGSGSTAGAPNATAGSFEVHGIEMHAVGTMAGSLADEPRGGSEHGPPPQMLAAKLLRVRVEHGGRPEPQPQQQGEHGAAMAVDAVTAGVHLLVQQQQLATVAGVVLSLLPPPKKASLPGTPPTGGDAGPDAGALVAVAAAAAAEAMAPTGSPPQQPRQPRQVPRLSFSCTDTLVLLPTSVAVPADQAAGGQLLLLPAAPALLLGSIGGSLGSGGGGRVQAEGCCLLYCEGLPSQRFPGSADAVKREWMRVVAARGAFSSSLLLCPPLASLLSRRPRSAPTEHAKATVLSVDEATVHIAAAAAAAAEEVPPPASNGGEGTSLRLELGAVAATADADAVLCLAAVADSAAQQLTAALATAPPRSSGASRQTRWPAQPQQRQPLAVTIRQLHVAQPMSAERDMIVQVDAVHAVLGAQGGSRHTVRTGAATLSMLGTPVLRYRQLSATLQLADPSSSGGRLQVQPLAPPWPEAAADTAAAASGISSGGYDAYHRARLEAWLASDAATAPGAGRDADAAAAAALGTGPASVLDASVSGAELVVPHDGEPGPTQRYSELYFKALETVRRPALLLSVCGFACCV